MAELMRSRSAEISKRTKERMADPEVRNRIRDGMQAASGEAADFAAASLGGSTAVRACKVPD